MAQRSRVGRFVALGAAGVVLAAAALTGTGPASADVAEVEGSAYGYFARVSLFGGPPNDRDRLPR